MELSYYVHYIDIRTLINILNFTFFTLYCPWSDMNHFNRSCLPADQASGILVRRTGTGLKYMTSL